MDFFSKNQFLAASYKLQVKATAEPQRCQHRVPLAA
jgi:hypothetical protein